MLKFYTRYPSAQSLTRAWFTKSIITISQASTNISIKYTQSRNLVFSVHHYVFIILCSTCLRPIHSLSITLLELVNVPETVGHNLKLVVRAAGGGGVGAGYV